MGLFVVLVACGGRQVPSSLDDMRTPLWHLAHAQLADISEAMNRWTLDGRSGCPGVRELRLVSPRLPDRDPWGRPYLSRCDAHGFVAFTVGPDGDAGTRDDASSPVVVLVRSPNDDSIVDSGMLIVNSPLELYSPGY